MKSSTLQRCQHPPLPCAVLRRTRNPKAAHWAILTTTLGLLGIEVAAARTMAQPCTYSRTLTEAEARYFLNRSELEKFLQHQFGEEWDFQIEHLNYRWKFKTPKPLDEGAVREWIEELQVRRRPADEDIH